VLVVYEGSTDTSDRIIKGAFLSPPVHKTFPALNPHVHKTFSYLDARIH